MEKWFRLRILVACLVSLTFSVAVISAVHAATGTPKILRAGDHGPRVRNLQWLLGGHAPSHYRRFHPYVGRPTGHYDTKTGIATKKMKFRLGYPKKLLNRAAGPSLFNYLLGHTARPARYRYLGAKRTKYIRTHQPKLTLCQRNIIKIANSQVGVREVPYGSNSGYFVHIYQSVTGAYNAPWCASFAQWVLYRAHAGPIASRSASVYYIASWARSHGYLHSSPRPGTLVLFLSSQGHMGVVTAVGRGGFTSVEGNYSNQVSRVSHFSTFNTGFVYLPHCSAKG